jgi:methylamine dehydrogenase accessory protein MauD
MSGPWLVSYVVLWVLVLGMCSFLIGMLRQLGLMHRELEVRRPQGQATSFIPPLEDDGPAVGSPMADLEAIPVNGFGSLASSALHEGTSLLVFMSPMCETCQHVVEPLNALVAEDQPRVRAAVVIRGEEQACRAFVSVFPLRMPVVCDEDNRITMGLDIHRIPFGLLYEEGTLTRKGVVEGYEDLQALLGNASASVTKPGRVSTRSA